MALIIIPAVPLVSLIRGAVLPSRLAFIISRPHRSVQIVAATGRRFSAAHGSPAAAIDCDAELAHVILAEALGTFALVSPF